MQLKTSQFQSLFTDGLNALAGEMQHARRARVEVRAANTRVIVPSLLPADHWLRLDSCTFIFQGCLGSTSMS